MAQAMKTTSPIDTLPADASMLTRIRVGLHALKVLKDDPGNPDYARLLHMSFDRETYARLGEVLRGTPEGQRLLDEQPTIPSVKIDFEALSRMPEGTLGRAFADYFARNGIEPFSFEYALEDDADYLNKRYRETHDIHHILTGYGIDPIGEVELQAFYYGNLGLRHAALIAVLSIPFQVKEEGLRGIGKHLRRIAAAYRRGKDSRELLSLNIEEMWTRPVSELARLVCAPAPAFS